MGCYCPLFYCHCVIYMTGKVKWCIFLVYIIFPLFAKGDWPCNSLSKSLLNTPNRHFFVKMTPVVLQFMWYHKSSTLQVSPVTIEFVHLNLTITRNVCLLTFPVIYFAACNRLCSYCLVCFSSNKFRISEAYFLVCTKYYHMVDALDLYKMQFLCSSKKSCCSLILAFQTFCSWPFQISFWTSQDNQNRIKVSISCDNIFFV